MTELVCLCNNKKMISPQRLPLVGLLTFVSFLVAVAPVSANESPAQSTATDASHNEYIVVFEEGSNIDDVFSSWQNNPALNGMAIRERYENILTGVSIEATSSQLEIISRDSNVTSIDLSLPVFSLSSPVNTQKLASWGIDDIDGRRDETYVYPTNPGKNVPIYIVDTPLMVKHTEFNGRARHISTPQFTCTHDEWDGLFHGTAVASVAAGRTLGVAKQAEIVSAGGLDCFASGSTSSLLRAFEDIYITHPEGTPGVVNMSIGMFCGSSSRISTYCLALEESLAKLKGRGLFLVAAAGNNSMPYSCNMYPSGSPSVFSVGAIDQTGNKANFSNWGECIKMFAPGSELPAAISDSTTDTLTVSGTSFSSPLVAGAAAIILGKNPAFTPDQVATALIDMSRKNSIADLDAVTPNRTLQMDPKYWGQGIQIGKPPHATVSPTSCDFRDPISIPRFAQQASCWAKQNGITISPSFNAGNHVTRAEAVTLLWRSAGSPSTASTCDFEDMKEIPAWGRKSACWAKQNGITTTTQFKPSQSVTRSQMVALLERSGYRQFNVSYYGPYLGFLDQNRIPSWAIEAAKWAYVDRVVTKETFRGGELVNRSEAITMLWRANGSI